ncbi:hypothetical protein MCAG_02605 [Micromonospora sp. ATCC 39149]|nr:hypothetical protein MCAG_02605 [Micromonospora sp. ATCC 39149]
MADRWARWRLPELGVRAAWRAAVGRVVLPGEHDAPGPPADSSDRSDWAWDVAERAAVRALQHPQPFAGDGAVEDTSTTLMPCASDCFRGELEITAVTPALVSCARPPGSLLTRPLWACGCLSDERPPRSVC